MWIVYWRAAFIFQYEIFYVAYRPDDLNPNTKWQRGEQMWIVPGTVDPMED